MAAHIYTALLQEYGNDGDIHQQAQLLKHALGYTMTFDLLQYDDWSTIKKWCEATDEEMANLKADPDIPQSEISMAGYRCREKLRDLIKRMLGHYAYEWMHLGHPECAEQWYAEKYGEERPYQFRHKPTGSIVTVMAKHGLTAAHQCSIGHWVPDDTLPECLDTTNFDEDWEAIYD
jgi:hypothetical protein